MTADEPRESKEARDLRSVLEALEGRRAEWFLPVLLMLVRSGLDSLRAYLEDPDEETITWAKPVVELQWPVEWDWTRWDGGVTWAAPDPEDLLRRAEGEGRGEALRDLITLNVLRAVASWASPGEDEGAVFGYILEDGRLRDPHPEGPGGQAGPRGHGRTGAGGSPGRALPPVHVQPRGPGPPGPRLMEEIRRNFLHRGGAAPLRCRRPADPPRADELHLPGPGPHGVPDPLRDRSDPRGTVYQGSNVRQDPLPTSTRTPGSSSARPRGSPTDRAQVRRVRHGAVAGGPGGEPWPPGGQGVRPGRRRGGRRGGAGSGGGMGVRVAGVRRAGGHGHGGAGRDLPADGRGGWREAIEAEGAWNRRRSN